MTQVWEGGAHGLANDSVAPDWPPLTVQELAQVLHHYPQAGPPERVAWHSPRPFAASALVACRHATVFVKRHDPRVRSVADLACEHRFIAHLRARGAPIPAVLHANTSATAIATPAGTYEIHALGEGLDTYRDAHSWTPLHSTADAKALGQTLACLHLAAEGFSEPPRPTGLLVSGDALLRAPDLISAMHTRLSGDRHLRAALHGREWEADFAARLVPLHRALQPHCATLAPLWAHEDFHGSNLLWQGGQVSAVLDFGLCNRTSATHDLATAIERNAIAWLDSPPVARPDLAWAILRGYDAARPRSGAEQAALPHMLPLVHLDFALSELAYFHGITHSACNAEAAYNNFLLGHAVWFRSKESLFF